MFTIIASIVAVATPIAQPVQPVADRKYCAENVMVGPYPTKVCMTRKAWLRQGVDPVKVMTTVAQR